MMTRIDNCRRSFHRRTELISLFILFMFTFALTSRAQVNSGSDGSDGEFSPIETNTVIDMADHTDGIYQYTSVNIPSNVTVTFIPNASHTPVIWLVQGACNIAGIVDVSGKSTFEPGGSDGGPGGFRGGSMTMGAEAPAAAGAGPGGGYPRINYDSNDPYYCTADDGGNGSFGTVGARWTISSLTYPAGYRGQALPGEAYGNEFLVPLIGGSGGGGGHGGGGGGGGAILIASSEHILISGSIIANGAAGAKYGGSSTTYIGGGGGGSGGAIRLVASSISGSGKLTARGGEGLGGYSGGYAYNSAGNGRIRIDRLTDTYNGNTVGVVTRGFQPIIIPPPNLAIALSIQTVAGISVAANPVGSLTTPDVIVPASQQNPIPIVVSCSNIPLGTEITVDVKPANGPVVRGIGLNSTGTQASSTATVLINMPRGGGTIQARAVSGFAEDIYAAVNQNNADHRLAATGWTTDGERFAAAEITATLGGSQQIAYLTESGKRYSIPSRN